jgi:hypothetical protein
MNANAGGARLASRFCEAFAMLTKLRLNSRIPSKTQMLAGMDCRTRVAMDKTDSRIRQAASFRVIDGGRPDPDYSDELIDDLPPIVAEEEPRSLRERLDAAADFMGGVFFALALLLLPVVLLIAHFLGR